MPTPQPAGTPAWKIKAALVSLIEGLTLPDLSGGVKSLLVPDISNASFPAVWVCSAGEAEEELDGGGTESQDTDWGFRVLIVDRPGNRPHEREPVYQDWRKRIMDAFRPQKIAAFRTLVPGVWRVLIRPLPVFDEPLASLPAYQCIASGLVLRVAYTEPRA